MHFTCLLKNEKINKIYCPELFSLFLFSVKLRCFTTTVKSYWLRGFLGKFFLCQVGLLMNGNLGLSLNLVSIVVAFFVCSLEQKDMDNLGNLDIR